MTLASELLEDRVHGIGLPLRLNNGRRGKVAPEDLPDRLVLDEGELNAEADDDTEHKGHDEEFE